MKLLRYILFYIDTKEASRGAAARGVTAKPTGCGFDPHSRDEIFTKEGNGVS